jgi:hypothetical protein
MAAAKAPPKVDDIFAAKLDDVAFGKGTFGGLIKADPFEQLVERDRDQHANALVSVERGFVEIGDAAEKRAAVVRRYRSGSITETHVNPDGSLGNHGSYHYSKRLDTAFALKSPEKAAGKAIRAKLV